MASSNALESHGGVSGENVSLRRRCMQAAIAFAAILISCWWSWYSNPDVGLALAMSNPSRFEGQQIKVNQEPILEAVEQDYFVVRSLGFRLRVNGTASRGDFGRFVFLQGTFHALRSEEQWDGVIEQPEFYVARGRRAKIWISVIPTAWIAALLLKHFRFDRKRLSVVLRVRAESRAGGTSLTA